MSAELLLVILSIITGICILLFLTMVFIFIFTEPFPDLTREDSELNFLDPKDNKGTLFPDLIMENPSIDLTIVVPAYNEEKRLPIMMDETLEYLQKRSKAEKLSWEIIVVDDGSKDKTAEVVLRYSARYTSEKVRLLKGARNRGKGGAVRLGMLSGRGKRLLFADADGATKFSDLERLEQRLKELAPRVDSSALVCGSRAHLQLEAVAQRSLVRNVLMYGFHFAVWLLCVRGVKDTQCGFKLFTRPAAKLLFTNLHVERWAFDCDLLYLAQRFNLSIGEVPVTWTEIPGSKLIPVFSWLQMGLDLMLIRIRYFVGAWKVENREQRLKID